MRSSGALYTGSREAIGQSAKVRLARYQTRPLYLSSCHPVRSGRELHGRMPRDEIDMPLSRLTME